MIRTMTASAGFRFATSLVVAMVAVLLVTCAGQGKGQPEGISGDADGATPPATADGSAAVADSATELDAPSMRADASSPPTSDASNDGSNAGIPEASRTTGADGHASEDGAAVWSCPAGPFGSPIPAGAMVAKVAGVPPSDAFNNTLFNFTTVEGPVWIGDALYVSEYPGNPNPPPSRILKISTSGQVSVAVADSGSNGLAVDKNGNLYGAVHEDGSISRFDLSTGMRILPPTVSSYMGKPFGSPNDLAIRSDGTIYFSDPNYHAPNPNPQAATRVYRFSPSTSSVAVIDAMLPQPNGVTFSPDEGTLYVGATDGIHKYAVMPDGNTGTGSLFPPSPSAILNVDGMVVDCAGNLYCAVINSGNIVVLSPTGVQMGSLSVTTTGTVTNVAFGGADHKTLYITTQGSSGGQGLFQVALSIPGMPY